MSVNLKIFNALLCAGMVSAVMPAMAGFEFAPASPAAIAKLNAANTSEEMPMAPMEAVTQEPLGGSPSAALPLPSAGVSQSAAPATRDDGVYIRRVKPGANEPVNTAAFLKSTANQQPLALAPQQGGQAASIPAEDQALVINPYPLGNANAVHTGNALPVEQAMMEQGGTLRPVGTPGQAISTQRPRLAALSGRANTISRADDAPIEPAVPFQSGVAAPVSKGGSAAITPIPGGEGPPLKLAGRTLVSQAAPIPAARPQASITPAPGTIVAASSANAPAAYDDGAYAAPRASGGVAPASNVLRTPSSYAAPSVAAAPRPSAQAPGYSDAVGFGRDLPLALALSQIVPPGFSFFFAQDVNVGQTVSWQGGKPWNEVLNDMLAPRGMRASIENNQVLIARAHS